MLILASAGARPKVGHLLNASRVQELPAPEGLGETRLLRAIPALRAPSGGDPGGHRRASSTTARALRREAVQPELESLRAWLHDSCWCARRAPRRTPAPTSS